MWQNKTFRLFDQQHPSMISLCMYPNYLLVLNLIKLISFKMLFKVKFLNNVAVSSGLEAMTFVFTVFIGWTSLATWLGPSISLPVCCVRLCYIFSKRKISEYPRPDVTVLYYFDVIVDDPQHKSYEYINQPNLL